MGTMACPSQTHVFAGKPIHILTPKKFILVGTLITRTMLQAGKADIIAKEMVHYSLGPGFGRNEMETVRGGQDGCGQPIIYSEHEDD